MQILYWRKDMCTCTSRNISTFFYSIRFCFNFDFFLIVLSEILLRQIRHVFDVCFHYTVKRIFFLSLFSFFLLNVKQQHKKIFFLKHVNLLTHSKHEITDKKFSLRSKKHFKKSMLILQINS